MVPHGLKCLPVIPITTVDSYPVKRLHALISLRVLYPNERIRHTNDDSVEDSNAATFKVEELALEIPDLGEDPGLELPPVPRPLLAVLRHLHGSVFADEKAVRRALQCNSDLKENVLRRINAQLAHPKDSLKQAIQMLGPTTVAGIILQLGMRELHTLRNGPAGSCLVRLVQHCEGTAILARHLADRSRTTSDDQPHRDRSLQDSPIGTGPFAMGFAHDLGKLALMYNFPKRAALFYGNERSDDDRSKSDELFLEQCVFGCSHVEAGVWTASQADLPAPLVAAAGLHHDTLGEDGGDDSTVDLLEDATAQDLQVVRAANLLTKTIGANFSGPHPITDSIGWSGCEEATAWTDWRDERAEPGTSGTSPKNIVQELLESGKLMLYSKFFLDRTNLPLSI